jgi:flavin reductase|tara:strand:+ start:1564 stop:2097 length:534 start_codon:yes stop_codon:yes gene_type:complete
MSWQGHDITNRQNTIMKTDQDQFLTAMRDVASTVAVITARDADGQRFGATVTSYCSVSASPPSLLICLNRSSTIFGIVEQHRRFTLNLMAEGDEAIANRFAGFDDHMIRDRFDGIEINDQTAFDCTVIQSIEASTHQVFIAAVDGITLADRRPLLYHQRRYHSLEGERKMRQKETVA